jgi:hypothetical protein
MSKSFKCPYCGIVKPTAATAIGHAVVCKAKA